MKIIAYAHCCVPDVAAARRLHDVEGLDDTAVAKILFHRRKQQSGAETLRADQLALATICLIHGEPEAPQITSVGADRNSESDMLQQIGSTLGGTGWLHGWRITDALAVLRLRAAQDGVAVPRLFTEEHQDLAAHWDADCDLDEAARQMGLPGLFGTAALDHWEAWLEGDHAALRRKAELQALNSWQLAQQLAVAQGRLSPQHAKTGRRALGALLDAQQDAHLRAYAAALED